MAYKKSNSYTRRSADFSPFPEATVFTFKQLSLVPHIKLSFLCLK